MRGEFFFQQCFGGKLCFVWLELMLVFRRVFFVRRQLLVLVWVFGGEKEGVFFCWVEFGRISFLRGIILVGNLLCQGWLLLGGVVVFGVGGVGQVLVFEVDWCVFVLYQQFGVVFIFLLWFWFLDVLWDSYFLLLEFILEGGGVVGSDSVF